MFLRKLFENLALANLRALDTDDDWAEVPPNNKRGKEKGRERVRERGKREMREGAMRERYI